jgi:hypothetical protein
MRVEKAYYPPAGQIKRLFTPLKQRQKKCSHPITVTRILKKALFAA